MGALVSALAFPVPDRKYSEEDWATQGDRVVWLTTKESKLKVPALHLRRANTKASSNKQRFTIIYSHGNAEDVGISIGYLQLLSSACDVNVLAYEYPGYSIAEGKTPSEAYCYEAIEAAYDHLTQTEGIPASKIVLLGRSLGTGPTVHLASKEAGLAGTILQSPLESGIRAVIGPCTSLALYGIDIFQNYAKISSVEGPVFIVHGTVDTVVPCANGKNLYAQLQEREHHAKVAYDPVWIPGRGHNDMPHEYCFRLFGSFLEFLEQREKQQQQQQDDEQEE